MTNKEFEIENNVLIKYHEQEGKTEAVIPDGITYIDDFAFYECQNLSSVVLPDSVENTGIGVFQDSNLRSVRLSKKLKSINDGVFASCKNLKSIDIPDSVETIELQAFSGCTNLTSITFGKNLQKVSKYSFWSCGKIEIINVPSYKTFSVLNGNLKKIALNTIIKNKQSFNEEDMIEFKKYIEKSRIAIFNCILYMGMDLTELFNFMLNDMDKIYTPKEIDSMINEITEQGKTREKVEIVAMLLEYKNRNYGFDSLSDEWDLGNFDDEEQTNKKGRM